MRFKTLGAVVLSLFVGCSEPNYSASPKQTSVSQRSHPTYDPQSTESVTLATFNIEVFGKSKSKKDDVMQKLVDIVNDFDLCAIQEIRDKSGTTIPKFMERLNHTQDQFAEVHSQRLGRTHIKENYLIVYNVETIEYKNISFTYPDPQDHFEREPFCAYFQVRGGSFDFFIVNVHIRPDSAEKEIAHLVDVVDYVRTNYPDEKDVIVIGDYNADGRYFDEDNIEHPFRASRFYWLIGNDVDTTVARSANTYDRVVFLKDHTLSDIVPKSLKTDNLEKRFGLSLKQTKRISDHYPSSFEVYKNRDNDGPN